MMLLKEIEHHILWVIPAAFIIRVRKYKQTLRFC